MNIEPAVTVLRREQLLCAFSAVAVIPPLTAEEIQLYAVLARLHDIGKRAIPQEILNKPGQLTQEEFYIMKSHTTQDCDLLEKIPELRECEVFPLICDVCRHHHERWDGNGYPDRLVGEEITPWVQVVGLAVSLIRCSWPASPGISVKSHSWSILDS